MNSPPTAPCRRTDWASRSRWSGAETLRPSREQSNAREPRRAVLHYPRSMSRIDRVTKTGLDLRLARDGGTPARSRREQPMFPGGMELGDEEAEAAARAIRSHNVFRYYIVGEGPHEVETFEREFAAKFGAK